MPNIPGHVVNADRSQVTIGITVEIEQEDPWRATAYVRIGGVTVWTGLVTWDSTLDPSIARAEAAQEAIQRWTDKW